MAPEDLEKFVADTKDLIKELKSDIEVLKTQYAGLVKFVNDNVTDIDRKVNAIDNVAFASLGILTGEGKKFELSTANIAETRAAIETNIQGFNDYRDKLMAEAKKAAEKEAKKAMKEAEVQAKRDTRKGRTKKEKTQDGGVEEKSN